MITRQELEGKELQEIQDMLNNDLAIYSDEVNSMDVTDTEAFNKKEQELMVMMDEYDKHLNSVAYKLPKDCIYKDRQYAKETVIDMVLYFLDKIDVDWNYVIGYTELSDAWKDELKKSAGLSYKVYDFTIRALGQQVKYRGYKEWNDIMVVNSFLSPVHKMYTLDYSYLMFLHEMHNMLLKKMQPEPEQTEGMEVPNADCTCEVTEA